MQTYDVQSVKIDQPAARVFEYVSQPRHLQEWTNAFKSADESSAELVTPNGTVPIRLDTRANVDAGTVDWIMTFPDGSAGAAYSRVPPDVDDTAIFSFVLMAPPVPLEILEGALEEQKKILATELLALKEKMEE